MNFLFKVELSSSVGNVGIISEKDFHELKKQVYDSEDSEAEQMVMPPKSNKTKIPRTPDKSQSLHASLSERVKEISTDILASTALHVDAPEFRPKLRTESKAKSVPAGDLRTPGRKSRGSSSSSKLDKNVPRFFPAIIKDDLQNKVSFAKSEIKLSTRSELALEIFYFNNIKSCRDKV